MKTLLEEVAAVSGPLPSRPARPLTAAQAAHRIGCSERQARQLAEDGAFPHAGRSGDAPKSPWAIPPEDVDAFKVRSNARERARWLANRPAAASADLADPAKKEAPPHRSTLAVARRQGMVKA